MLPSRHSSTTKTDNRPQVNFDVTDEVQNSKDRMRTVLLLILSVFLAAATATGAVATAMQPWWTQTKPELNFTWIEINLWEACNRQSESSAWECRKYTTRVEGDESPFKDMELLQKCIIAASSAVGVAFLFNFLSIFGRFGQLFKAFLYIVSFLASSAAILFALCIAYTVNKTKQEELVPTWIKNATGKLKVSLMFYVVCTAAGCSFLAFILTFVTGFIDDDEDAVDALNKEGVAFDNERESGSNGYGQSLDFEREISRRGKGYIKPLKNQNNMLKELNHAISKEYIESSEYNKKDPSLRRIEPELPEREFNYVTPEVYTQPVYSDLSETEYSNGTSEMYRAPTRPIRPQKRESRKRSGRRYSRNSYREDRLSYQSDVPTYPDSHYYPRHLKRDRDSFYDDRMRYSSADPIGSDYQHSKEFFSPRQQQSRMRNSDRRHYSVPSRLHNQNHFENRSYTAGIEMKPTKRTYTGDIGMNSRNRTYTGVKKPKEHNGPFSDYEMYFNAPY